MLRPLLALSLSVALVSVPAAQQRRPLSETDIADIATLLKLEDIRQFDEAALGRILKSAHPEVRRRAAISIGRIADPRGLPVLQRSYAALDREFAANVLFSVGQIHQPESVTWLQKILMAPGTAPVIAREAARSLGKMVRNEAARPAARAALAAYLAKATESVATAPVIGEALLSIGRFAAGDDIAPIARWAASRNVEVRWRAAWALFRPADPAALPHLIKLSQDASPEVRYWAVRGFRPAVVDANKMNRGDATGRLRTLFQTDPDRRVRTEALRTLLQYDDEAAFGALVNALYSTDSWISVSAAEAAGRFGSRALPLVPLLVDVAEPKDPLSMKIVVMPALVALAPDTRPTLALAAELVQTDSAAARSAGLQALGRLGDRGKSAFEQLAADPALTKVLPTVDQFVERYVPAQGAGRAGGGAGRGGGGAAGRGSAQPRTPRPDAEYRALVERWIVPAYNGAAKPRAIWETPRGTIELELNPAEAPFGVEHFMRVVESGDIVGTEFTRVVPDFVAQQQGIRSASTLRDEVNRLGLTRGNLSWASAGLDTGRPGYTLGHTPQPHNEGDFTSLGRVVGGMDIVDKIEIGDKVTGARIIRK